MCEPLGARSRLVHNPYVSVLVDFMRSAGRSVRAESCEPAMGPKPCLGLVELPGGKGWWAAYDVTVVCPGERHDGDWWEEKMRLLLHVKGTVSIKLFVAWGWFPQSLVLVGDGVMKHRLSSGSGIKPPRVMSLVS